MALPQWHGQPLDLEKLRVTGEREASSAATFDSCEAAIADAQRHGYSYAPSQTKIGRALGMRGGIATRR